MQPISRPDSSLVAVFCAVFATMAFAASASIDGWFRFLPIGVGLVLVIMAIASITATRKGAPEHGWLPSRDRDGDGDGDTDTDTDTERRDQA